MDVLNKKRVYLYFSGGVGNQLFQYAFGLYVSKNNANISLVLDYSNYHKMNNFRLKMFDLPKYKHIRYYCAYTKIGTSISKLISKIQRQIIYKIIISPNDSIEYYSLPVMEDRMCLKGYWQNSSYYIDMQNEVRSMISIKNPREQLLNAIRKIQSEDYCAIHIRRGDYDTFYDNSILPPSYYDKAMQIIEDKDIRYLVFSDDIKWCKEYFRNENIEYICDFGVFRDYEELILMSKCTYHIIANSSFSWWGAYLSNSKKVICPYYLRWDERFYMPSWIGIEVKKQSDN